MDKKMVDEKRIAEALKPTTCKALNDVKKVISSLKEMPNDKAEINTRISWRHDGETGVDEVKGISTGTSLGQILIDGMIEVKNRIELMNKVKASIKEAEDRGDDMPANVLVWDVDNIRFKVDLMIENRMGGKRKGLRIRWKLDDGCYEYDPFAQKLFKVD